jgi:hypothetical protein
MMKKYKMFVVKFGYPAYPFKAIKKGAKCTLF